MENRFHIELVMPEDSSEKVVPERAMRFLRVTPPLDRVGPKFTEAVNRVLPRGVHPVNAYEVATASDTNSTLLSVEATLADVPKAAQAVGKVIGLLKDAAVDFAADLKSETT